MISVAQLKELAQACHELGIKRLATCDITLDIDLERIQRVSNESKSDLSETSQNQLAKPTTKEPIEQPVESVKDTKKVEDLIETLKMNDEELVNKLFPSGAM